MIARTLTFAAVLLAGSAPLAAQTAPIVLPGAPGQPSRSVSAAEAIKLSDTRYSPADVQFMQGWLSRYSQYAPDTFPCRTMQMVDDLLAAPLAAQCTPHHRSLSRCAPSAG